MRFNSFWLFSVMFIPFASAQAQLAPGEKPLVDKYINQQTALISKRVDLFTLLTQPYAPLDFQVRRAGGERASSIRNILFGFSGKAANIDDFVAPKMANDFHCGSPCATARIKEFVAQNQRISPLISSFLRLDKVNVISQWSVPGDFRINDTFVEHGTITAFSPAGSIGIVPNSAGKKAGSLPEATGLNASDINEARSIAVELASLHLAAIVRSPEGVRVIRTGNADNQCGLLFKRLSAPEPKKGDDFGEGLEIIGVTMLAKDIYYFETT